MFFHGVIVMMEIIMIMIISIMITFFRNCNSSHISYNNFGQCLYDLGIIIIELLYYFNCII